MTFFGQPTKDLAPAFFRFNGIPANGDDVPVPTSLREFALTPADEPWVYSCLNRLFMSMQQVPLRVYEKKGRNLVPMEETKRPDGVDLQYLLDNINTLAMNGADFRGYTIASYGSWGGGYWKKVRGVRGGPPQEIYWLPAPDVTPEKDPAVVGAVRAFRYQPNGTSIREDYAARDVLAFRRFNLADPTQLLSPLSAGRYDISISRQATMQAASVLNNWSIPLGAWVAPKGEGIQSQDVNLIRRVLRQMRGPRGAGKTPVLPNGLEWKPLALNPKDAEWLQARKVSRLTVCGLLGVPLLLAGDDESTGPYAYAREIKKWFWETTIQGHGQQITDTLNGWLVPDFDKTRTLICQFDYSEIEALKPPETERRATATSELFSGARVINEYRAEFKVGPPVDWGNEPYLVRKTPAGQQFTSDIGAEQAILASETTPLAGQGNAKPDPQVADTVVPMKHLYSLPEVAAFQSGQPLDLAFLGIPVTDAQKAVIETGLRRRYSSAQIANGVAAEQYPGLRGT